MQEFATAARLDPTFFEAQMNYAAVNLTFRGFAQSQAAYQKALAMRPNDYDAHLGLALALRGLITDVNYDTQVAAVQAELDTCKKLDAARPDAYYNEGILTQEFRARTGDNAAINKALTDAQAIFQTFIDRAGDKPEYAGAVKRSKERIQDCKDIIAFNAIGASTPSTPAPAAPPAAPGGAAAPAVPAGGAAPAAPDSAAAPPAAAGAAAPAAPAAPTAPAGAPAQ